MKPVLIALDWGTSRVRAALLDEKGKVIETRKSESGVGVLSKKEFKKHFEELVRGLPICPVLATGMVGSRQGWYEVPYVKCPVKSEELAKKIKFFKSGKYKIGIVSGVKLQEKNRFDVMRGEETQIAGLIASMSDRLDADVILPGTHCKWVKVRKGEIVEFQTYLSGEMFEMLCNHSILQHSLKSKKKKNKNTKYIKAQIENKQSWQSKLFGIRARHLLADAKPEKLQEELSVDLIVAEVKAAMNDGYGKHKNLFLIGTNVLIESYSEVLKAMGKKHKTIKGKELVYPALFDMAQKIGMIGNE